MIPLAPSVAARIAEIRDMGYTVTILVADERSATVALDIEPEPIVMLIDAGNMAPGESEAWN